MTYGCKVLVAPTVGAGDPQRCTATFLAQLPSGTAATGAKVVAYFVDQYGDVVADEVDVVRPLCRALAYLDMP